MRWRSACGARTRAGLGHVPGALLGRLSAPLLLVRPGMRPLTTLRRLLVPLEGSPSASEAMRVADDLFCARGREILMLHVVTGDVPGEAGSLSAPRLVDQEHYEWAEWKEEFSMRFSQCSRGGRHRVKVRVGEVAPSIVEEAEERDADLILLSWGGSLQEGRGAHRARAARDGAVPAAGRARQRDGDRPRHPPRRRRQLSLRAALRSAGLPDVKRP